MSLAADTGPKKGKHLFYRCGSGAKNSKRHSSIYSKNNIKYVVCLIGFECFEEDIRTIAEIKKINPACSIIAFGHYPTHFTDEYLEKTFIDIIIKGEPELAFRDFISDESMTSSGSKRVLGTNIDAFAENNKNRIKDYNELPMPAYDLVDHSPYHEPMMARPFGMIQTARGCPYSCTYCTKSFGTRLTLRSPEQVVAEIETLQKLHHIKSLRFIDDTFTINKNRVTAICDLIAKRGIKIEWSCLSRTDNIDENILREMKSAGCKRIYYGVESGSQRILDFYKKDINVEESLRAVHLTNQAGIETAGFFMLGLPEETESDFESNKEFIARAKFDYIGIGGLVIYPGTPLFQQYKDDIDFSLFPYKNAFKNESITQRYTRWNKELYKSFLFQWKLCKESNNQCPLLPLSDF
jgi:radical SAM superfamily enzyme YgiQ (UPF0313 family)